MSLKKRVCPKCKTEKEFRTDVKTCGCGGTNPFKKEVSNSTLKESSEIVGSSWNISLPKTRIHTLEQLIEFCQVDLSIWEVERFVCNKWEMGYTTGPNDDKRSEVEPLYQIKAFLKRKVNVALAKEEIQSLLTLAKESAPKPSSVNKPKNPEGGMLEINLADHHFGKMAWGLETLNSNYDVKIATKLFNRALDALLDRSPFSTYKEIWFVVGNDILNSDDTSGRTTAGTPVESDVRHEKTYVTVRTLLVQAIEHKLRQLAKKVRVIVVPGNHDRNSMWHLGDSLELYFSKYDDVEVDNRPSSRKYHVYGNTLIGYAHGDKAKGKNLPLLMAAEAREDFGRTLFHEWHTGHKHQTRTEEFNGIRVRILPALCPPDAWHAEMGFVGNLRSSEAFVWDEKQGLIGIVIYTDSDELIEKASNLPTAVK